MQTTANMQNESDEAIFTPEPGSPQPNLMSFFFFFFFNIALEISD